mgnify:CR=1 FL=1
MFYLVNKMTSYNLRLACAGTLLSGLIIAKLANPAILCGFAHVSTPHGLKFI